MKADDSNGQDTEEAEVKSEKASDSKISIAKKISTSLAIIEPTNKTSTSSTSTMDKNLSSHISDFEISFSLLDPISTSETSSKDLAVVDSTPKYLDSQMSVPGVQSKEEETISLNDFLSESAIDAQPILKNLYPVSFEEFLKNKKSTTLRHSKPDSSDSNAITSLLIEAERKEKTALNDSLDNQPSSTAAKPSLKETLTTVGAQPVQEYIISLTNPQSPINEFFTPLSNITFEAINCPQFARDAELMKSLNNEQKASNILNAGQRSMSKQNETTNTTLMISKNNHKTQPVQNSPTKGMKRKAADFFYLDNSVNNLGNNSKNNPPSTLTEEKKNKKKQKVTQLLSKSAIDAQPILKNLYPVSFEKFLKNESSTTLRHSKPDSSDSNAITSLLTEAERKEKTSALNDSLDNQPSSTAAKPSLKETLTTVSVQPVQEEYIISLTNPQSPINEFFTSSPNITFETINSSQFASDAELIEEKGTSDNLLQIEELRTKKSLVQNNSCANVNLKHLKTNVDLVEDSSASNFNADKSPKVKIISSALLSVNKSLNNVEKASNKLNAEQRSMSKQNETANTTSMISKNNLKTQPLQNSLTKGVKRKAADLFYLNNSVNKLGNNSENNPPSTLTEEKKNKKKQKVIQPPISKKPKKTKQKKNNFWFTKNSKSLMCAIVEDQYPNMPPLTNVHLGIIRNLIKEKIDNLPCGVFIPKFMNAFIKNGVIIVECADNNSKEWLKNAITNYNPKEGIYLKVIPPEALNQYYPASIFVHDEENASEVLNRMQKQNSDISVRNWEYLSTTTVKNSTPGITINVEIPATSIAELKEKNFRLFHALDQVSVIMKVPLPF